MLSCTLPRTCRCAYTCPCHTFRSHQLHPTNTPTNMLTSKLEERVVEAKKKFFDILRANGWPSAEAKTEVRLGRDHGRWVRRSGQGRGGLRKSRKSPSYTSLTLSLSLSLSLSRSLSSRPLSRVRVLSHLPSQVKRWRIWAKARPPDVGGSWEGRSRIFMDSPAGKRYDR